jgi:hypothetical protein
MDEAGITLGLGLRDESVRAWVSYLCAGGFNLREPAAPIIA